MEKDDKEKSRGKYYKLRGKQAAPIADHAKDYVFFWHTVSPFSNWHPSIYTYDGIEFNCSEQGVMWSKAKLFGDEAVAEKILKCNSSQQGKIKSLGRDVKHFKESIWKKNRINVYWNHCHAKFSQNENLKEKLLNTGNKLLAEAAPNDAIWGIGLHEKNAKIISPEKWPGTNLLGIILTEVRESLK